MASEDRPRGLPSRGTALLILLLLGLLAVLFTRLLRTMQATAERDECEQRQARLSDLAQALDERLEAAQALVHELAGSEAVAELLGALEGDGPPALGAFTRLDALLEELGTRSQALRLAVWVPGQARPLAAWSRRPWEQPPALATARPEAGPEPGPGRVELSLSPAREVEAALVVRRAAASARLTVALDASAALRELARASAGGSWALLEEQGPQAAPLAGDGDPQALLALDPRENDTVAREGALLSALRVGTPRWRLLARVPSRQASRVVEQLGSTLILAAGAVVLVLFLGVGRARASYLQASLAEKERQEAFQRAVFDAITDELVVVDRELSIVRANRVAEERWGSLVGRPYAEAFGGRTDDMARDLLGLREVLARGRPRKVEVQSASGQATWELAQFPIFGAEGVSGVVEYAVDVTQDRLLRARLVQSEKLSTLGEMAAGIAHEINNPLGVISMFAQLLAEEVRESLGPEAGALEKVKTIEDQATHVGQVVTNLLRFARKSEGVKTRLDARTAAERALSIFAHQKGARGVEVVRQLGEAPLQVLGDEAQLAQVLLNLLVNGTHAMQGKGRLTVTARPWRAGQPPPPGRAFGEAPAGGERVLLSVEDQGHGIPPEVLDRIFEPFFTTKPVGEGTGLGLSVSFAIVRDHGGCVWVASRAGEGTTFTLDLPAAPAQSGGASGEGAT